MRRIGKVLQFRVTLEGITPIIWRRIVVPSRYSFWDLHVAIQNAMGWMDSHLHLFRVASPVSGLAEEIGIPDDDAPVGAFSCRPGWEVPIAPYFTEPGQQAEYEYDFGDDWQHLIVFEGSADRIAGRKYPACVAGERACPPEDCGGVHGYQEMLRILADPADEEHRDTLECIGPDFRPDAFDPGPCASTARGPG